MNSSQGLIIADPNSQANTQGSKMRNGNVIGYLTVEA